MRDNLQRVKGILSAQLGVKVPNKAKYYKSNGTQTLYSSDNVTWYKDNQLTDPYWEKLDEFISYGLEPVTVTANKPVTTVVGAPEVTPTTSVENAAKANQQTQAVTEQKVAEVKATQTVQREPLPELPKVETPLNAPTTVVSEKSMNGLPSTGMNIQSEPSKEFKQVKAAGIAGQAVSTAFNIADSIVGAKQAATDSNLTKGADTVYDMAADAAKNFGPVGKVVGTAMKFAGTAGDIIQELGGGTDQQTTTDKWMDSSFFSWNIGMLNGFAGKKSDTFGADRDILEQVGSSYGGTTDDILDAAEKSGKKYGLFSSRARKKANSAMAEARSQQNLMGNIADSATDQRLAVQSMGEQAGLAYSLMTDGGYSQKYTYAAKHGGLIEWNPIIELEWHPQIELNWELPEFKEGGSISINEELEWLPEFKDGGKVSTDDIPEIEETNQKNVIPEGALHKNKHHMEHAEGLTKKGIPVIDEDGEQQAEIEHSEIIFTLEVTKKLEEYYEIFYDDDSTNKEKEQAALDAGKLLVYQILENTEDRTGLIDSCKKGGTLTLKKSTEDLIEELDWEIKKHEKKPKEKFDKEELKEIFKEALIEMLLK